MKTIIVIPEDDVLKQALQNQIVLLHLEDQVEVNVLDECIGHQYPLDSCMLAPLHLNTEITLLNKLGDFPEYIPSPSRGKLKPDNSKFYDRFYIKKKF